MDIATRRTPLIERGPGAAERGQPPVAGARRWLRPVFRSTRRGEVAAIWMAGAQAWALQRGFVVPQIQSGRLAKQGWGGEAFVEGRPIGVRVMPSPGPAIGAVSRPDSALLQQPLVPVVRRVAARGLRARYHPCAEASGLVAACRRAWRSGPEGGRCAQSGRRCWRCCARHRWGRFARHRQGRCARHRRGRCAGGLHADNILKCPEGRIALTDRDECRRGLMLVHLGRMRAVSATEHQALIAGAEAWCWLKEPEGGRQMATRPTG